MTKDRAENFIERVRSIGFTDVTATDVGPCAGYFRSGKNIGQPRSDQWYASVRVADEEEQAKLIGLLAQMGANRKNTDVIKDQHVFRFTRLPA